MEEKNRNILKKALEQLPEFKADARIWDKIEQQLDNEVTEKNSGILKKSIHQLPVFKADKNSWNKIEKELDSKPGKVTPFYVLKIAASFIVIVGLSIWINNLLSKNTQKELITFSQETLPDHTINGSSPALEKELNELIQQQCQIQPDICMNPVFTELKEELSGLTESLNQIKALSKNSNNDPEIYKYIIRIQKERVEISKKLFHFFDS